MAIVRGHCNPLLREFTSAPPGKEQFGRAAAEFFRAAAKRNCAFQIPRQGNVKGRHLMK